MRSRAAALVTRRWGAAALLLPFLALYTVLAVALAPGDPVKDEPTYLLYAHRLLAGGYAPEGTSFLWSGPGYPLLLAAILGAGLPPLAARVANALLLYGALLLVHAALRRHLPPGRALLGAAALGLYWPAWEMLPYLMTEPLALFLTAATAWAATRPGARRPAGALLLATTLGGLALTKIIVGHVLAAGLAVWGAAALVARVRSARPAALAHAAALALCLPYLAYTFSLTGDLFRWGTSGGLQLYWMTSPYPEEQGDWINVTFPPSPCAEANELFRARHGRLFRAALGRGFAFYRPEPHPRFVRRLGVAQDRRFRAAALRNLRAHPGAYAGNWLANLSRMLLDTPYSYRLQEGGFLGVALANGLALLLLLPGLGAALRRPRQLPPGARVVAVLALLYLGGSSLVSAYPRQAYVALPLLVILAAAGRGRKERPS